MNRYYAKGVQNQVKWRRMWLRDPGMGWENRREPFVNRYQWRNVLTLSFEAYIYAGSSLFWNLFMVSHNLICCSPDTLAIPSDQRAGDLSSIRRPILGSHSVNACSFDICPYWCCHVKVLCDPAHLSLRPGLPTFPHHIFTIRFTINNWIELAVFNQTRGR